MRCFALVRDETTEPTRFYKSEETAKKEMEELNRQVRDYNEYIKTNNIDRKPIKEVYVKEFDKKFHTLNNVR